MSETEAGTGPAAPHPPDPNAGVVRATPPGGRSRLLAAAVAAATILVVVLLAVRVG